MSLRRLNDGMRYTDRGAFRDQITLMMPSASSAPDGSPNNPVVFANEVWASIKALRSQEVNTTDFVQGESWYDVRIPYMDGITSALTVISPSGATWLIVSATDPDQRQVEIRMLCREVDGGDVTTEITEYVQGSPF
jgi:SPP1 family predicted phage head-tail adaptor